MTSTNNLVITIFGVKNDGKSTLADYVNEKLDKPALIIDVTEQFEADRKYKKMVKGVNALRYELMNKSNRELFIKGKFQLIFRPQTNNITKEVEDVIQTVLDENIQHINILFDEIEIYADNYISKNSPIFQLFYISRNRDINIISVVKVVGMLHRIVKLQTDYFMISQIDDTNAEKFFLTRNKNGQLSTYLEDMKPHEFLVTDLKKYFKKIKLKSNILRVLEKKKTI